MKFEEHWETTQKINGKHSFLAEVKFLVKSRPLYNAPDTISEETPITLNDLIIGTYFSVREPKEKELLILERSQQQKCSKESMPTLAMLDEVFRFKLVNRSKVAREEKECRSGQSCIRNRWKTREASGKWHWRKKCFLAITILFVMLIYVNFGHMYILLFCTIQNLKNKKYKKKLF